MVVFIAKVLSFFMPTARLRKNARRKLVLAFWTHCAKRQVKVHGKGFVATARCGLTKQTEIGEGAILGGVSVLGAGKVKFGNYVSTGPNVVIQTQSHEYEGEMLPYGVGYRVKDVEIGDAVLDRNECAYFARHENRRRRDYSGRKRSSRRDSSLRHCWRQPRESVCLAR